MTYEAEEKECYFCKIYPSLPCTIQTCLEMFSNLTFPIKTEPVTQK